ncbi:hypothetical protein DL770_009229 [Monosporascus sp. CRB-9-2]|nr:hypothetical protein DL770_009229 [Monosporascus sp. CRB-9-2]
MRKRAAATKSSESAFRFQSKAKGVRFMNDANHSYGNPSLTPVPARQQAGAKWPREEYGTPENSLPVKRVKREGGSLYGIPRQAGQRDVVNCEPKDEGRATEGPAPVEDRDALKHLDEEATTPVKGTKRSGDDGVNLYDIPERPTPAKKPRHDDVSGLRALPQHPVQEGSSAGVRTQQGEAGNAGL